MASFKFILLLIISSNFNHYQCDDHFMSKLTDRFWNGTPIPNQNQQDNQLINQLVQSVALHRKDQTCIIQLISFINHLCYLESLGK